MVLCATKSSPSASQAAVSVFTVTASAEPGTLIRVLGLFAVRDLVPRFVSCVRELDLLRIEVEVGAVDDDIGQVLAAKLRQIIAVTDVALTRHAAGPPGFVLAHDQRPQIFNETNL